MPPVPDRPINIDQLKRLAVPLEPPRNPQDRITTAFTVTYDHLGDTPIQVPCVFDEFIENPSQEQPFQRRILLDEGIWQPLDLGWFANKPEEVGLILIENLEGRNLTVNPTTTQRNALAKRLVMVAFANNVEDGIQYVVPRDCWRNRVANPHMLVLQGTAPDVKAKVHIFPR